MNPKFSSLLAVSSENAFTQKDNVSLANFENGKEDSQRKQKKYSHEMRNKIENETKLPE